MLYFLKTFLKKNKKVRRDFLNESSISTYDCDTSYSELNMAGLAPKDYRSILFCSIHDETSDPEKIMTNLH